MPYFQKELVEREYSELMLKGYLKLKFQLPIHRFKDFDNTIKIGKEIPFHFQGKQLKTVITSIEIGEKNSDTYGIFLGFALQ